MTQTQAVKYELNFFFFFIFFVEILHEYFKVFNLMCATLNVIKNIKDLNKQKIISCN